MGELFLIGALSLPSCHFTRPALADQEAIHYVATLLKNEVPPEPSTYEKLLNDLFLSSEFLNHVAQRHHKTPGRVLVVDGIHPELVTKLRHYGFEAFGLDVSGIQHLTPWHARGTYRDIPFKNESIYVLYWLSVIAKGDWLTPIVEAIDTVERNGFLVFDKASVPSTWEMFLSAKRWEKLPFFVGSLSIWQKPGGRLLQFSTHWSLNGPGNTKIPIGNPKKDLKPARIRQRTKRNRNENAVKYLFRAA